MILRPSIRRCPGTATRWALALALGLVALWPLTTVAEARDVDTGATSAVVAAKHKHKHGPAYAKFTVSTFNVLGNRHTAKGGKHASWPGGAARMRRQMHLLENHGVDVVGFQELQPEQLSAFNHLTGPKWGVYPGGRLGNYATHNSIAWKKHHWTLIHASYLLIPYFHGERVKMPVVKLKDNRTGRRVYFANFHNPANSKGNAQKWRNMARRMEIRLARRIHEADVPLVLTGDMNEKERYFCAMTSRAPMKAANGGRARHGRCRPPRTTGIDWIFGSRNIEFWDFYKKPRDELVGVTDHPFLVTEARIHRR
jgi:endonuclease/exonuclease/phosphatase family metal-dependent hydrolase